MELRYYQKEAIKCILNDISKGKNPLLIMATGTGKTIVFAHIAKICMDMGMNTLILAHREELINQAVEKIFMVSGKRAEKEIAAEYASKEAKIVIGSVMSMQNKRLERWEKDHFQLIIIDETHHAVNKTYKNILNYFTNYNLFGVTATPDRLDQKDLSEILDVISYDYSLKKAIEDKFLCPIIGKRIKDVEIDLKNIRMSGKDLSEVDLGRILLNYIIPISNSIIRETKNRKTLIFMPDVKSSKVLAEELNRLNSKADYLSGERKKERKEILYKFKIGQITHLTSCNILLEGFDDPSIDCVVMLRPTTSRSLYSQAVGRGTRLYKGKSELLLLEFTYNFKNLNLVKPYELFSSKNIDPRIIEKLDIEKDDVNLVEELKKEETEWKRPENFTDRLITEYYGFQQFDPFTISEFFGVDISNEHNISKNKNSEITERQSELLSRYGIDWTRLNRFQASVILETYRKEGYLPLKDKATRKQKLFLHYHNYKYDKHIMKAQASVLINLIKKNKLKFGDEKDV